MGRIYNIRSRPDDSRRKYLNRPTVAADAWLDPPDAWTALEADVPIGDGDEIVMFFDGSKSKDATALVGCHVETGHVFKIGVWERPPGAEGEGWQVPADQVDGAVDWAFGRWSVVAFWADVREFESYVHTSWPRQYGERLILWASKTGKSPGPIAWDMRSHVMDFTLAAETAHTEIMERRFTQDGSSVVARHVANMRGDLNRWGMSVRKESPDSPNKIDAGVCVIAARMLRRRLLASSEWLEYQANKNKLGRRRVVGW
jgi:hypothetical protein